VGWVRNRRSADSTPAPSLVRLLAGTMGGRERQLPGGPDGILARQRFGQISMGGVVRQRRVLPWGALSDRELMATARQKARQSSGVDAPPGWWVAAQVLYGWVVVPDGDPHGVLTGAVAAQVVAADLRTPSRSLADRPWVAAVTAAADAAVSPSGCSGAGLGCGCCSR